MRKFDIMSDEINVVPVNVNRRGKQFRNRDRKHIFTYIFPDGATAPSGRGPPPYRGITITLSHTTVGRAPLDVWSARRSDLYLTTHNTHNRQTSMHSAEFEPAIPASEWPQTRVLRGVHSCNVTAHRNAVTLQVTDTIRSYELNFHPVPHDVTVSCER